MKFDTAEQLATHQKKVYFSEKFISSSFFIFLFKEDCLLTAFSFAWMEI